MSYQVQEVVTAVAGEALEANRIILRNGTYCDATGLRYLGVTLKDAASGDNVPVGLPGVAAWQIYCTAAVTAGDILEHADDGKLAAYSSGKAAGQAVESTSGEGLATVLLYCPQSPALTS